MIKIDFYKLSFVPYIPLAIRYWFGLMADVPFYEDSHKSLFDYLNGFNKKCQSYDELYPQTYFVDRGHEHEYPHDYYILLEEFSKESDI